MKTKLSRRKFLSLLAVAPVVPYLVKEAAAEIIAEVDFGFTFGKVVSNAPLQPGFAEIIRTTLQKRAPELRENLASNNSLLLKLQGNQHIKVHKIDPSLQEARINDIMEKRRLDRQAKRCSSLNERLKWREEIHKHDGSPFF